MTAKLNAKHILMVLLLLALGALAACGGGGGEDGDLDPNLPSPSITSLSVNVANLGDTVEIYGSNFGDTQGSGSASCNGTEFTVTEWTKNKLTVMVPTGMTSGIVQVKQNGKLSTNGPEAQLYIGTMPEGTPLISAVNPNYGNTGAEVQIIGRNFGSSSTGNAVFFLAQTATSQATPVAAEVVTVEVGGVVKEQWTPTSIKVLVPGELLQAGEASIYVMVGTDQSNSRPFTKLPEQIVGTTQIDTIDPVDGPVGTLITITGDGFGFTQGSSTITIGGLALDVIEWTNTQILAQLPTGANSGAVRLMIGGTPYDSQPFTVGNQPAITGVAPSALRIGKSMEVYGTYFGAAPGTGSLKVGSTTVAVDESNWSNTHIYIPKLPKIAAADPADVPVVVTADNGLASEAFSVSLTSDIKVLSTVDPAAGEVGTTSFTFTIIASGGSGEYTYELFPDANNMGTVTPASPNSVINYTYPNSAGFATKTFKTKVRVNDADTGDSNIVDGPEVLVVAQGAPVIISMAVQDFNRGGVNAPNDWVLHPITGVYHDFSFDGGDMYFTSANADVLIDGETLPAFTRNLEEFMNNGADIIGGTPRPYGYRYGSAEAPASGSYVRVMGLNFGDTTGQVYLNSTLDGTGLPSGGVLLGVSDIIEWTTSYVVFRMPSGINQALSGSIVLQTSDSQYAKSAKPLLASAYVTAIAPNEWQPGGGDTIQISGFDFLPPQIPGVSGSGTYVLWMAYAQYNDPFAGGAQATRQVLRITPIPPSNIEGNTIYFPTSELTGTVKVEVTNAAKTASQIVDGTLQDGNYSFWLWTGVLTTGSQSQIAMSGLFSAAHSFTRGAGGTTTYSISGRVTDAMQPGPDNGADGVTVNLTGLSSKNTVTDLDGNYSFTGLVNGAYTVTPEPNAEFTTFAPASELVNINNGNVEDIDFAGTFMPGP